MTLKMKCITVRIEDDNTITVELISKNQKLIINKRMGLLFNMSYNKFISIFGENIDSTDVYYRLPDGSCEYNYDYSFLYNMINKIVTIVNGRIVDINPKTYML